MRLSQLRPVLLEHRDHRIVLVLHLFRQRIALFDEIRMFKHGPRHDENMGFN